MPDIDDAKETVRGVADSAQTTVKNVADGAQQSVKQVAGGARELTTDVTGRARQATSWVGDFKEFISRGNVVQVAVGVSLGAAFNAIIASLVNDILIPIVGALLGGVDFKTLSITVGNAVIAYGKFIQAILNFAIVALVLFWIVRLMNKFWRKQEEAPAAPPPDVQLLGEIRDLLKGQSAAAPASVEPQPAG